MYNDFFDGVEQEEESRELRGIAASVQLAGGPDQAQLYFESSGPLGSEAGSVDGLDGDASETEEMFAYRLQSHSPPHAAPSYDPRLDLPQPADFAAVMAQRYAPPFDPRLQHDNSHLSFHAPSPPIQAGPSHAARPRSSRPVSRYGPQAVSHEVAVQYMPPNVAMPGNAQPLRLPYPLGLGLPTHSTAAVAAASGPNPPSSLGPSLVRMPPSIGLQQGPRYFTASPPAAYPAHVPYETRLFLPADPDAPLGDGHPSSMSPHVLPYHVAHSVSAPDMIQSYEPASGPLEHDEPPRGRQPYPIPRSFGESVVESPNEDPRRYRCRQCPFATSRPHDLKRHERTQHNRTRTRPCSVCGKDFARSDALTRHKKGTRQCPARVRSLPAATIPSPTAATRASPTTRVSPSTATTSALVTPAASGSSSSPSTGFTATKTKP